MLNHKVRNKMEIDRNFKQPRNKNEVNGNYLKKIMKEFRIDDLVDITTNRVI